MTWDEEARLTWESRKADAWNPAGASNSSRHRRPVVGEVIGWERRAWEVMHVRVDEPRNDAERERLSWYRDPEVQDLYAPYMISLRRLYGPTHPRENSARDVSLRAPVAMSTRGLHFYEGGRVPLCSCCGHPWPCLLADSERAAEASGELMERRMARMGPGICYGCGEPISTRQGKFTMRGDHADFPGAPAPEFHARKKCDEAMTAYKRRAEAMRQGETSDERTEAG